jgi:predicted MFS family arabinose efflux permease
MGAISDKYGAGRTLVLGALFTMSGLFMMYSATSEMHLLISGVLLGIGIAGTGITALVGAVGRAVPAEKRAPALATLGMASGIGGFIAFPYTHFFMGSLGWQTTLLVILATISIIIPLAAVLAGKPSAGAGNIRQQTLSEAFGEAFKLPSFWLLVLGFFVCGFHVAFYATHLPAYVADKGLASSVAVWALTGVGIANIIGTYIGGQSGKIAEKRTSLAFIYFMRSFAFLGLLFLPTTEWTVIGISILLGFFWLATVPLTSALVATFFGAQWMSMLFGFVFLSHQLGSFLGVWLAGRLYDITKSYDTMWWLSIALALFAALIHLPIREKPVARLQQAPAAA